MAELAENKSDIRFILCDYCKINFVERNFFHLLFKSCCDRCRKLDIPYLEDECNMYPYWKKI